MEQQVVTIAAGGRQVSPAEYTRLTLYQCLRARIKQLPATHDAADYAEACAQKIAELDAACAADDQDAVREILAWEKSTHAEFTELKASG